MMEEINLLELIDKDITKTTGTRKLSIKGETKDYSVYKIPLEYLFYNDQNGRIATYISKHEDDQGPINRDDNESYNQIIHEFIVDSNRNAFNKTKNNIKLFGQRLPGVVLQNGRIIDGNRRFTCLRELKKEVGKDYYFEAVILDTEKGISPKDIKRLELNLQHGEERPVDYNPIDNLVDVYRDLVENETFTIKEYAVSTNKKDKEVEKLRDKAILMVEFLEFINAKGKYYIARDLNLDGPLQEIMVILKRTNEDQEEDVKNALFASLLTADKGDLTRHIREIGKEIINTKNAKDFLEEYEDVVEEVYETLQEEDVVDISTINQKIGSKKELKQESKKIIEKKIEVNRIDAARNKPIDLLERSFHSLDSIDTTAVSRMGTDNKEDFKELLEKIQATIDLLGEKVNV
ncbi:ParB/RepB/Spo0J family partition protein [Cytobacillus oceanisediminis]|uniref:ParB/RepB/Spo0J family partition protein n=1 Tax=Cytobacillus oceanisediminis TaxID=665099 RepID=UPI00119E2A87|nr:ParB/RepB/Spo0J family partition protein [Cytobacillus oceanisediminis]